MVRFLKYEKKAFIDKVRERNVKRLMMVITLVTFIPSVVIGFHMVRVSLSRRRPTNMSRRYSIFPIRV